MFFNIPYHGHMNPTVPLVAELVRRGDQITYYTSEAFRPAVEQAGASFRGIDAYFTEQTPVDANLVRFSYTLIDATQRILPELLAGVRAEPPDYILFDSLCIWGRCIAEILRIPAIGSVTTIARPHSSMHREVLVGTLRMLPDAIPMLLTGREALRKFNAVGRALHDQYQIPRVQLDSVYNNLAALNIVYSIRELQAWPNSFDERFQFVGPLLGDRGETEPFPFDDLGDRPLIYVSLGTVFNANDDFYRQCFRAFADSRYCVALAIGEKTDPRRLEPIPDNFIVRSFMPQLQVLRRAALFITHGGMNSVNEALFEGIPLLVVPQGADQFLIAGQVQRLGAGKLLRVRGASAANLRSAAEAILADPAYRQRSEALGARLHQAGGAMAAADAIDVFKRRYQLA